MSQKKPSHWHASLNLIGKLNLFILIKRVPNQEFQLLELLRLNTLDTRLIALGNALIRI